MKILPRQKKYLITLFRLILLKIPRGYQILHKLNIYHFGEIDQNDYAFSVFKNHFTIILQPMFQKVADDELMIAGFMVVMRPRLIRSLAPNLQMDHD